VATTEETRDLGYFPADRASPSRVGRFAPSPTGLLHIGSARTALAAWLSIRRQEGIFIWRIEDLDPPRAVPGTAQAAMEDLRWLGLDWDEGPDCGGHHGPYRQSERGGYYEAALEHLASVGRLFPCSRSRKDLLELASAPHGDEGHPPYPAAFRPRDLAADWYARHGAEGRGEAALRFLVEEAEVTFEDRVFGRMAEGVATTTGDFVLKRRDGLYAYQLAVVVDDLAMGVTEVVRGADLLDSTARQIQLIRALGGEPPVYAHLPLVVNAEGEKLSKRDAGLTLAELREAGTTPEGLCGYLGYSLGLLEAPQPLPAAALVERFSWERIPREPWHLPAHLPALLERVG
jgi:glutamyl-tRNA synthetase